MEKDVEQKLAEVLAKAIAKTASERTTTAAGLASRVIEENPDFFRSIQEAALREFVVLRTRSLLREILGPPDEDKRQMRLDLPPIKDYPDVPPMIVVKQHYGSPMKFPKDDVEYWLRWAKARAKGIDERNRMDKKGIRELAKLRGQAKES